jgi:hypothetical protein
MEEIQTEDAPEALGPYSQGIQDGNTLYDVTKRLRHATILTTERVYSHFDRV